MKKSIVSAEFVSTFFVRRKKKPRGFTPRDLKGYYLKSDYFLFLVRA